MRRPVVLFLCTGNSARSQMAEAFLKRYAGDRFKVHSAGLEPRPIHPMTIRVMNEIGISMEGHRPQSVSEYLGKTSVSYAIFVCEKAEKECPFIWPFAMHRLSWPFDDPAAFKGSEEEQLEKFRDVRNQIEQKVKHWVEEAVVANA